MQTVVPLKDYSNFCPRKYYSEYYSQIGNENSFLMKFFHEFYKDVSSESRVLEFGGGPTIYQLISAGSKVKEIVFAEYLECNRNEIKSWMSGSKESLNWEEYLSLELQLSSKENSELNIRNLKETVSSKVTDVIECDAYLPEMLINYNDNQFDVVSSNFCLECIDGEESKYIEFVEKITGLVERKGKLALCMLKNAESYQIDDLNFPSYPVNEEFIVSLLKSMNFSEINLSRQEAEHEQGYEGIIAVSAKKL